MNSTPGVKQLADVRDTVLYEKRFTDGFLTISFCNDDPQPWTVSYRGDRHSFSTAESAVSYAAGRGMIIPSGIISVTNHILYRAKLFQTNKEDTVQ